MVPYINNVWCHYENKSRSLVTS